MTLVVCAFTGWLQVRLATNPDPPDELRGVSGYTFALPGEPDFDRLLRTSDPVAPRTHGPPIGVFVRRVSIDGADVGKHPLVGARVDLLSSPCFQSVNDVVMAQGIEALEPFDLQLAAGDFRLRRRDYLDLERPDATVYTVSPELLAARRTASFSMDGAIMKEATGSADAVAFRKARLAVLEEDYAAARDPLVRAGLTRRIAELRYPDPNDRRTVSMHFIESRTYSLNGPTELVDPAGVLPNPDTFSPFRVDLVMGSWDADALSAYAAGTVSITTH